MLVLLTLMLIFVYLLYVVFPLFKPAAISADQQFAVERSAPTLALGVDTQGNIGYRIDSQGKGYFIRLNPQGDSPAGAVFSVRALSPPPVSISRVAGGNLFMVWV